MLGMQLEGNRGPNMPEAQTHKPVLTGRCSNQLTCNGTSPGPLSLGLSMPFCKGKSAQHDVLCGWG